MALLRVVDRDGVEHEVDAKPGRLKPGACTAKHFFRLPR